MESLYGEEKLCNFQFVTFACRFFYADVSWIKCSLQNRTMKFISTNASQYFIYQAYIFLFVRHQKHFALDKQQKWKAINTQFHRSKGMIRILLYIFCVSFSTLLLTWQNIQVLDSSTDYDSIFRSFISWHLECQSMDFWFHFSFSSFNVSTKNTKNKLEMKQIFCGRLKRKKISGNWRSEIVKTKTRAH